MVSLETGKGYAIVVILPHNPGADPANVPQVGTLTARCKGKFLEKRGIAFLECGAACRRRLGKRPPARAECRAASVRLRTIVHKSRLSGRLPCVNAVNGLACSER